jgi:predicted metal-dependent phosphoesterase TrpH
LVLFYIGGIDDGVLSPENVILWHLANGFNAAIITGHNSLEPGIFNLLFEEKK